MNTVFKILAPLHGLLSEMDTFMDVRGHWFLATTFICAGGLVLIFSVWDGGTK